MILQLREAIFVCVISGFRREVDENCVLLGCYTASSGNNPEQRSTFLCLLVLKIVRMTETHRAARGQVW
jgi:hypothetical protein